jgi:hypothetical protein
MEHASWEEFEALRKDRDNLKASLLATAKREHLAKQQIQLFTQQIQLAKHEIERLKQLQAGTFYSTIDDVWLPTPQTVFPEGNYFRRLIREKAPMFLERTVKKERATSSYTETLFYANLTTTLPACMLAVPATAKDDRSCSSCSSCKSSKKSESFEDTESREKVWPVDVFNARSAARIAHLIPKVVVCRSFVHLFGRCPMDIWN